MRDDELTRLRRDFHLFQKEQQCRTRLCHHFQAIANLPPNVYMDDDPNVIPCHLKHTDNRQLMREVAVDVLTKHARVRSRGQYLKILCDFHFWCSEQQVYNITDIGINQGVAEPGRETLAPRAQGGGAVCGRGAARAMVAGVCRERFPPRRGGRRRRSRRVCGACRQLTENDIAIVCNADILARESSLQSTTFASDSRKAGI